MVPCPTESHAQPYNHGLQVVPSLLRASSNLTRYRYSLLPADRAVLRQHRHPSAHLPQAVLDWPEGWGEAPVQVDRAALCPGLGSVPALGHQRQQAGAQQPVPARGLWCSHR